MSRSAGTVVIQLTAGTAALVQELSVAKARFADYAASAAASANKVSSGMREIGTSGVSEIQAASGAIRVLEGGIQGNVRAAERFLTSIAGLGPALQKIFPLVGGVAIAGLLVKIGEEAYKAGQNFLYLRDAEKEAMNVGIQLAGEADSAFAKISSLQVQALDEQGKHMEAAQEKQRDLMSTPVKLPDLLNQEKIKKALDTMQNQPGWIKLKNLFSEVIPADIPARIEQMKAAMGEAQAEVDKINQHRVAGFTDPLSAHFFAQDTVEVNLYAQALELLSVKQKEVAQEVGAAGAGGFKKSQEQAGSLAVKNVENEIQANARLTELKKQTAETIIKQTQLTAEASIEAMTDPYARAIALANLEVEVAKQKQTLLTKIASDGADEQIALLYKKAEAEKTGKNPVQQSEIDAATRGGVSGITDQSAANTLELHYAVEVAQQKARVTGTEEQRKAYADLNKEIDRGFESLTIGWKDAQERMSRYMEEMTLAEIKANEIREKSQGEVFDLRITGQKLTLEKQYGEEIAHTYGQQIAYMQQVANLDHDARQAKIAGLQGSLNAIPNDPNNPAEIDKRATLEGQIAVLKAESANADIEAATKLSEEMQKQKASLQAQKEIAQTLVNWSQIGIGNFEQEVATSLLNIPQEFSTSLGDSLFNRPKRGQTKGQEIEGGLAKTGEGAAKSLGTELLTTGLQKLFGGVAKDAGLIAALTANTAAVSGNTAAQTGGAAAGAVGGAGGIAGIFTKLFGPLGKLFAPLLGIFGLAEGTDSAPGGLTLVGEKGPEIRNVPRGSQIIPNHLIGSFLGATSPRAYPSIPASSLSSRSSSSAFGSMVSSQTHSVNVGGINIYETSSAAETARQLSDYLKGVSPQWSPAG